MDQPPPPGLPGQPNTPTDGLAIAAMVVGILSIVGICCWPVAIVLAIVAIVLGHVSARSIKSSQGAKAGAGMAKAGFILGYISLALIMALVAFGLLTKGMSGLSPWEQLTSEGGRNLSKATDWIDNEMTGGVSGNTQAATNLAYPFVVALTSMNDESLEVGEADLFVWCELRDDSCAFILQYSPVTLFEDKKQIFFQRAWQAAQLTLQQHSSLPDGAEVAIGIREIILYSDSFVGTLVRENNADGRKGLRDTVPDDPTGEALMPFFSDED